MPYNEAMKRRQAKYYEKHKAEIAEKRRDYYKVYNETRPKIERDEEARKLYNPYHREYRRRKNAY